jgi:hypothetical protein
MSDTDPSIGELLPGLLRVVTASVRRTAEWGFTTATTTTLQVVRSIASGAPPATIVAEATAPWRDILRELSVMAGRSDEIAEAPIVHTRPGVSIAELRAKGAQLLRDSADVWYQGDTHPAYVRILDELSPDEARILRLLATEGPQPSIDIRTSRPLGVGSELIEGGLSMVGLHAGVRHPDRTRANLNNLHRLGLVWFSREQVEDPSVYQVVEVQPDVAAAIKAAGRSHKAVYRSIELTAFGDDFCATCLPLT